MSSSLESDPLDGTQPVPNVPAAAPPPTTIQIERFPDGLTANIPPAGFGGTKGLFFFAVVWNVAIGFFSVLMISIVLGGKQQDGAVWVLPLLLSVFCLVGIGLLLASLNMARRRAAIAVTGSTLMVIQTGLFGSKQRTWEPGDVEAVRVGPSGMTVNNKPVMQLQIIDGGADTFGMLTGRRDEELQWLAAELRAALNVPSRAS